MRKNRAVALRYGEQESAPRIVAKGVDILADQILRIARDQGIHVEYDPLLAQSLMGFDVGDFIPEELYEVVAQLLAFVYKLKLGEHDGHEKAAG
jgi:flagellar biosynthesis protein